MCKKEIDPDSFRALVAGIAVQEQGDETWLVNASNVKIPDFTEKLSLEQIRQAQEEDAGKEQLVQREEASQGGGQEVGSRWEPPQGE